MARISGHEEIPIDIPASRFKAACLRLMDQVEKTRQPIIITKHGRPVAQLAPVPSDASSLFGYMKDTMSLRAEVMEPLGLKWSALSGEDDHF
jgi:prevent-host-death family protein